MKRFGLLIAALLGLGAVLQAQSIDQYLQLRKKHGISQAVGIPALETLLGTRIMELQVTVKGTVATNRSSTLYVERTDGRPLTIDAKFVPEWLVGNSVKARLLVHASRPKDGSELEASLIAAASEHSVARIDAAHQKALAAERAKQASKESRSKSPNAKDWNLPTSEVIAHYASFIKGRNKRLSDREAWDIARGIVGFSVRYGVDARLIMAMVMVESGFNPSATSHAGAQGLGQLMPGTARGMGITNSYDTMQNLYGTVRVVRGHMERFQKQVGDSFRSLVLALAAYNAGSGAVRRHAGLPPYQETQNYIRKVVSLYNAFVGSR